MKSETNFFDNGLTATCVDVFEIEKNFVPIGNEKTNKQISRQENVSRRTFAKLGANSIKIIHMQPPPEQSFLLDTGEIKKFPGFPFRQIIKRLLNQPFSIRPHFLSNRFRRPADKKPLERDKKDKENNLKFCLSKDTKIRENNLHKLAWDNRCKSCRRVDAQNFFSVMYFHPGKYVMIKKYTTVWVAV